MEVELSAIERNKTWELVRLPPGRRPIGLKWVYKLKRDPDGNVLKHKARILLALAGINGWHVHHLDVKSAFLHGKLEEEVYVTQPEGFVQKNKSGLVYKLSKALYGLRQAPRAWNARLDKHLKLIGFVRCAHEYVVYIRKTNSSLLIVGTYVDDLIVTGTSKKEIDLFKKEMNQEFEMSDMGLLTYYLGIEVSQKEHGITLKQTGYAKKLLEKTGMLECNPTETPMEHNLELTKDESGKPVDATEYRSIVGGLRYLCHTRPDISYAVGVVSRFLERPTEQHNHAVKRILRYIKGTLNLGLVYTRSKEKMQIVAYSDNNHARDVNDRRSTGGMVFYLNKNLVTWNSQKQQCVALSSCEAEFMAVNLATCQGIWVRRLVQEITGEKLGPVTILIDNKSTLELVKHPVFHGRSKHIDTRFHFIRECIVTSLFLKQ
ncbi:hypothetical protein Lser_V15G42892 [Lactuca serriola]